ncbi:hypothetical protein BCR33DRAFT_797230 [Rhizoclosmatium globosum]|uniref:G-protein coupled receptors family 2 profile 2 domain-containing protein n=1 Tax=Rhizoclosmatium globosum TaxID=329046 RepID=A0A1Y2AI40_9FUNG|nr:hypothetical protein BCR33DRAFT_797230 [Rhizoclosmatium globosum]|eukprot:ORY22263.1 hypothetical protein BCR33DRAFT_797230 [Rhizoclosmatium globosum]
MLYSSEQLALITAGAFTIPINLAVIACVAFTTRFHKVLYYMQVCLAVSEIICAIDWTIIAGFPSASFCQSVGTWHEVFLNSTVGWTVLISVHCYVTVLKGATVANSYWWYYHAYGWGVPVLLMAIGLIVQKVQGITVFGSTGAYCWIKDKNYRVYLFYVELWIHIIFVVILYCFIFQKVLGVMTKVSAVSATAGVIQDQNNGASYKSSQISTPKLDHRDSNDKEPPVPLPSPTFTRHSSTIKTAISVIKPPKQSVLNDSRIKAILFRAVLIAGRFIVVWTPPTTVRVMQYYNITIPKWLALWMTVSFSMMGIWNAFVFFLTSYWNEIMGVLGLKKSGESSRKESTNGCGTTGDASSRV